MRPTIFAIAILALAATACGGTSSTGGTAPTAESATADTGAAASNAAAGTSGQAATGSENAGQAASSGAAASTSPTLAPGALPGEAATGAEQTLPSGLKIITIKEGSGEAPKAGQTVSVHYTGYLTDGTKFDSSVDRGQPFPFQLGTGAVIKGWDEGIAQLKPGGKAKLIVPPDLGYAASGFPPVIPPNATLIFDVELLAVQ